MFIMIFSYLFHNIILEHQQYLIETAYTFK